MVNHDLSDQDKIILKTTMGITLQILLEAQTSPFTRSLWNHLMKGHGHEELITIDNIHELNARLWIH